MRMWPFFRTYYYYNDANLLIHIQSPIAVERGIDDFGYTYDAIGRKITETNGNNVTWKYYYDDAGRVIKTTVVDSTEKVLEQYTYDNIGNVLTNTDGNGNATTIAFGGATTIHTYNYDNQNRLTDITTKVNNVIIEKTRYSYDNNGNTLTTTVDTYTDGSIASTKVTVTNTYDKYNQLIKTVTEDGTVVTKIYNAEGYRVGKATDGTMTYYLYEADKVILEMDASGNQKARNVYGTNLLIRTADSETYYYMYNGHADVTALITMEGSIAATYYYDAFGNILESTGDVDNNILYSGYQYDEETGLYYLNARMYDLKIARFLQEDTYAGNPNDPLSLNLYTYCANNPIIYNDPTGHEYIRYYDGSTLRTKWKNEFYKDGREVIFVKEEDFWLDDNFFTKNWWKDDYKLLIALNRIVDEIDAHGKDAYIDIYGTSKDDIVGWRRLNTVEAVFGVKVSRPGEYDGRGDLTNAIDALEVDNNIKDADSYVIGKEHILALIKDVELEIKRCEESPI